MSSHAAEPPSPHHVPLVEVAKAPERVAGRQNLLQLVQMRWLAVAGQLLTILVVSFVLGISLPLVEMVSVLGLLVSFNVASWLRSRLTLPVASGELFAGLMVDVAVLTTQLYFSGGSTNPFIFVFLLQVAVGSVLLSPRYSWALVFATSMCFVALTRWHRPLLMPEADMPALSPNYVGGLLLCFLIIASLLVIFIGRISRNLRQRDNRLADLRQRAAEEEHIVRMGLLASGAAHELGTPLATMSVILGDWARMTPFAAEPELREEIEQMQVQVNRCKAIVTGILQTAGETRGEAPEETTLHAFLTELLDHFRLTREVEGLQYDQTDLPDLPIISDAALKQMIDNILDNALEAAPQGLIRVIANCDEDTLTLRIQDQGPGFSAEMLNQFGKPYQSSKAVKGRPGRGLGLFLSVNVARALGGRIEAHNRPGGGAEVAITLPLIALMSAQ